MAVVQAITHQTGLVAGAVARVMGRNAGPGKAAAHRDGIRDYYFDAAGAGCLLTESSPKETVLMFDYKQMMLKAMNIGY
jgi:hypothetical protein